MTNNSGASIYAAFFWGLKTNFTSLALWLPLTILSFFFYLFYYVKFYLSGLLPAEVPLFLREISWPDFLFLALLSLLIPPLIQLALFQAKHRTISRHDLATSLKNWRANAINLLIFLLSLCFTPIMAVLIFFSSRFVYQTVQTVTNSGGSLVDFELAAIPFSAIGSLAAFVLVGPFFYWSIWHLASGEHSVRASFRNGLQLGLRNYTKTAKFLLVFPVIFCILWPFTAGPLSLTILAPLCLLSSAHLFLQLVQQPAEESRPN